MKCPKCNGEMVEISNDSFSALKCDSCAGIWFNEGELDKAKATKGAESIDNTNTNSSAAYNEVDNINCPICNQRMTKMVDKDQFHIHYELCSYCRGVFFDSGEFKDLKDHKLVERVSQAVKTFLSNL